MDAGPSVKCAGCDGTGRATVGPALRLVYDAIATGGPATPATLAGIHRGNWRLTRQAVANRLDRLERVGLATSERRGRERIYTAVKV